MPQLLALEWNNGEVRLAVASGHGRHAVIEQAFSIAYGEAGDGREALGRRIAAELDARGLGRPETLVAVGRTSIELRQLQLPPAPDEELPELVRFQAAREFNELDDRWLLDFVPIDERPGGPRTVLATAIAPAMVAQIEAVCRAAGLKMRRLLLRSCAAAARLAREKAGPAGQVRLLVDLLPDEAELTAVAGDQALFLRTTRVSGDPPPLPALVAEIRLTLAAVQNQLRGRKVGSIVFCGQGPVHAELARCVQTELGLPTELFDPLAGLELGPAVRQAPPEHPGRFAPVLGALLAEVAQSGQAIDFLHPRHRIEPRSRRKKWVTLAATAGAALLAYCIYARVEHYLLAAEVERLEARSKALDQSLPAGKKVRATVAEISKWTEGEVVWLDQLYDLSRGFPPAKDALLGQWTASTRQGGSQMDLKGWVRDSSVIPKMEEALRAGGGQSNSKSSREDPSVRHYSWRYETSVSLKSRGEP